MEESLRRRYSQRNWFLWQKVPKACTNPSCDSWHPPERSSKKQSGCNFGEKCSLFYRGGERQPNKRTKKGGGEGSAASKHVNRLGCVFHAEGPTILEVQAAFSIHARRVTLQENAGKKRTIGGSNPSRASSRAQFLCSKILRTVHESFHEQKSHGGPQRIWKKKCTKFEKTWMRTGPSSSRFRRVCVCLRFPQLLAGGKENTLSILKHQCTC